MGERQAGGDGDPQVDTTIKKQCRFSNLINLNREWHVPDNKGQTKIKKNIIGLSLSHCSSVHATLVIRGNPGSL